MELRNNKIRFLSTIAFALIFLTLWLTGFIGIWVSGMAWVVNATDKFTNTQSHVLQGEYSVSVDLGNLHSNIGKILYQDGKHKIYVSWMDNTGSSSSGGYRIGFRSCGQYSIFGASLISGVEHAFASSKGFSTIMSAKMVSRYNGKAYESHIYSSSGLNYRDGDEFGFYIFPGQSYENGEVSLNEKGVVQITITNLYRNVWSRKALK